MLPRQSGDAIPRSAPGILVAVADRLDSLVGLVAAGAAPERERGPLRAAARGLRHAGGAAPVDYGALGHPPCYNFHDDSFFVR